jgi:general secretion pathway protein N
MPRFRLVVGMSCLFLILLLVTAPARLLGFLVPTDRVLLQGFNGSVWRGSVARCLILAGHGYVHLGSVSWQLSPLSLLTLTPSLVLSSEWGDQVISGRIAVRDVSNFDVQELEATISASLLRQYLPLGVGGSFSAQVQELVIRDGMPESGQGRVLWRDASWFSPQGARALGSYALDFEQPSGGALEGEIQTISGLVDVTGTIQLHNRNYSVDIFLENELGLDPQLQQALSLFGQSVPDRADQAYRLQLSGDL